MISSSSARVFGSRHGMRARFSVPLLATSSSSSSPPSIAPFRLLSTHNRLEESASKLAREMKNLEQQTTKTSFAQQLQRIMVEYSRLNGFMWGGVCAVALAAFGIGKMMSANKTVVRVESGDK